MSYFDNANTDVTRRSFGSKVDKTFQREGVIPVKERKKEERDLVAESAKYKELNKKVDDRRMKEAKDARAYEVQLREGYETLKDDLMKDILTEICVESILVDKPDVEANLKNIIDMIEEKVDEIGGFNGIKHIAESTNNGLLKNMVSICEATCKKVGERNLKEAKGNPSLLDMKLNKIEMEEFGNRKKEIGSETIINHIKDKVFQVVKDEQEMNTNRQEIMSEIENKVMDLNGPVQEAMNYIFESHGVEEATLFDSLMRRRYKDMIQNESSVIFESLDIPGDDEEDFEDQEFAMSDIELVDEEDDEAIEDIFLRESVELLAKAKHTENIETITEAFNEVRTRLDENAKSIKTKKQARQFKNQVKYLQEALEGLRESKVPSDPEKPDMNLAKPEKGAKKVEEEIILCPKCGKEECKCKSVKESFDKELESFDVYYTQMNDIIEAHEVSLNHVMESIKYEIDGKNTVVPYLQTKDCNLNNLELVYKTKIVCETLKDSLKNAKDVNDMAVIERAVELNIQSLTESINAIKDIPDMKYKSHILKSGRKYLGRLQEVMNGINLPYADPVTESTEVFNSADDVDRVFNIVREYYVIESTDNQLMETVMAEAIVEYTILEAFNTLRLMNFTKESVRQMARKNISK